MIDYIIIGAQRCGTTSLYNYICRHHRCAKAIKKEVHFFDKRYHLGRIWYTLYFPGIFYNAIFRVFKRKRMIIGESSPFYLYHPLAPKRVYHTIPEVKLIVLLRNPVERAYSHYQHEVRRGNEHLSFSEAISQEEFRLKSEHDFGFNHSVYSYRSRGVYIHQLKRWRKFFPKKNMMVISSESFYKDPQPVMNRIFDFLGIEQIKFNQFKKHNSNPYQQMEDSVRHQLSVYYRDYNQQLYDFLKTDFGWQ